MKTWNLTKSAAVGLTLVTIGLGVQYLNTRVTAAGPTSKEISSIAPLEMMRSSGQLPSTVVDHYI